MTPTEQWITVSCIELVQPIGKFYIGAIDCHDLVRISFADRRRIEKGERDIEIISGIQRPLSNKRVEELQKYVNSVDASFPTGIIIAINADDAEYDERTHVMRIRNDGNVAKIIDGQHRIQGLVAYEGPTFQLNVTMFVDMDMEDQALLFATINLKQTPVSKSLVFDLYEFAETRSPQKTCHNIARLLNTREGSPFFRRIMILGTATGHPNESLTQAAFIQPLIRYITSNDITAMEDRDLLKRGKTLPEIPPDAVRVKKLIFRNLFVQERDAEIARVMWNYFTAVAQRWPEAWELKRTGIVLNRTTGYRALMRFLPLAYLTVARDMVIPTAEFKAIFDRVKLESDDFTPDRFKPGTSGQSELYRKLQADTRISESAIWKGVES
ncbi:MAG: DGQHR domain-containing protein [Terriglobia bacterium]|nr:DGQHR domain-containing protein [Terriglobia bacterium]